MTFASETLAVAPADLKDAATGSPPTATTADSKPTIHLASSAAGAATRPSAAPATTAASELLATSSSTPAFGPSVDLTTFNTTTTDSAPSTTTTTTTAAAPAPAAAAPTPATRPPPRPSFSKSRQLESEPNPFEQSFSGKSPDPSGVEPTTTEAVANLARANSIGEDPSVVDDGLAGDRALKSTGGRRSLPSISQVTTPLGEDEPFNWNISTPAISSLRNGPLSPAMLAGPKQQPASSPGQSVLVSHAMAFNPSDFVRTGLTPGTGLTPQPSGPLPPPSPNTAAFLAMVTNATAGAAAANGVSGPSVVGGTAPEDDNNPLSAMTPGTFNGVMSQLSQMNGAGSHSYQHPGYASQHPSSQQSRGGDYFSHVSISNGPTHVEHQLAQQQQQQPSFQQSSSHGQHSAYNHPPPPPAAANGVVPSQRYEPYGRPPHQRPPPPTGVAGAAPGAPGGQDLYHRQGQQAASQAANGLFLLSQAHQEIAKRENGSSAPPGSSEFLVSGASKVAGGLSVNPPSASSAPAPRGGKRKSSAVNANSASTNDDVASSTTPGPPKGKGGRAPANKRTKKAVSAESDEFAGNNGDGDGNTSPINGEGSENGRAEGMGADGKPETEEEKRKNFLERNRQAALKCRQRKKAWLGQLQAKVEYLQGENDGLLHTVATLREEVARLQSALSANGALPPGAAAAAAASAVGSSTAPYAPPAARNGY